MSRFEESWLMRHKAVALIGLSAVIFMTAAVIAELALRLYVPYNPGFYVAVKGSSTEIEYPYGTIKINSHGFPDDEFDLTRERKIGYFGDSVTYGVGAGHGFRVSDLLAEAYPEYEHLNFAGVGLTISPAFIDYCIGLAKKFDLDTAIYFFNLNDIVPDGVASGTEKVAIAEARRSLVSYVDWLRGKSYLYTYMRTAAKNYLEARGVGYHGYSAYELQPEREIKTLRQTAGRINDFHRVLAEHGVELIVVLLPYEMQISQDAEETYRADGVRWEAGFIDGRTQEIVIANLDDQLRYIDAYDAFVNRNDRAMSRARIEVGEYFVYNKGDKLDWNHPNRAGHRVIADYLKSVDVLPNRLETDADWR